MYVTGFSSASLEMLVIIAFQILFGFLYAASGIIFAIFMTGLVFGTHIKNYNIRFIANLKPLNILIIMIFLAFLIPVCLLYFSRYNSNWVLYPLVAVALLLPAILTGLQFTTSLEKFEIANAQVTSQLYRADLLGSALGFLLTAAVLIPLLGMLGTSCLLIIINLMALFVIYHNVRNEKFHN
jgi:predicted membrane-bound spermidine synthase